MGHRTRLHDKRGQGGQGRGGFSRIYCAQRPAGTTREPVIPAAPHVADDVLPTGLWFHSLHQREHAGWEEFFHLHRVRDDVLLHVEPEEGLQRFLVGGYAVEEWVIAHHLPQRLHGFVLRTLWCAAAQVPEITL